MVHGDGDDVVIIDSPLLSPLSRSGSEAATGKCAWLGRDLADSLTKGVVVTGSGRGTEGDWEVGFLPSFPSTPPMFWAEAGIEG
jgi:hypothetical protein